MWSLLPSPNFGLLKTRARRMTTVGALLILLASACTRTQQPAADPGPPIKADPPVSVRSMVEECDGLISALTTFKTCVNLEDEDRQDLDAWIERAQKDFAAGRKAKPEQNAQVAIAMACLRATRSVEAATERCNAGPRPKDGWYERRDRYR